jgi:hypothetical protein
MSSRPGPKPGEKALAQRAWQIALRILCSTDAPACGYGRQIQLARMVNEELGCKYQDDSIHKAIGPSLREWERNNPKR